MKRLLNYSTAFLFLSLISFFGCSEIRLIGAYDTKIDDGIQKISKDLNTIFVKIDKAIDGGTGWGYSTFTNDYIEIEANLKTLITRANGLPKYSIITSQLTTLQNSIQTLEADHKTGFASSSATNAQLKAAIKVDETAIQISISAMLKLQEALKREKTNKS